MGSKECTIDLGRNHQPLLSIRFNGKRGAATGLQRWMTLFHGSFDVLWVMVMSRDDDQILQSAGNEQLALAKESQISRTEKRPFLCIRQIGPIGLIRLLRPIPITLCDAGTGHPNLSDFIGCAPGT